MDRVYEVLRIVKRQMNLMRRTGLYCDVRFSCGGRVFPAHRAILIPYANYLSGIYDININDHSIDNFILDDDLAGRVEDVLNYIYTGPFENDQVAAEAA